MRNSGSPGAGPGTRLLLVNAFLAAGWLIFVVPAVGAQAPGTYESCEEAFEHEIISDPFSMSCYDGPDGAYIVEDRPEGGGASSSPGWLGAFIVFALLWTAIPVGLAVGLASRRGASVGVAVLITLVFGWIGLLVLYFMYREVDTVRRTGATAVDRLAGTGDGPVKPRPSGAGGRSATSRLRELEDLRKADLITESEFAERRSEILREV